MTVKAIGAVLIMTASVLIGINLNQRLTDRMRLLMSIRDFLLYVKRQISYDMPPLSEVFGDFNSDVSNEFFDSVSQLLLDGSSIEDSVQHSMQQLEDMAVLNGREREFIVRVFSQLGSSDCDSQISLIDSSLNDIDYFIENAVFDKKQRSKVYLTVSVYSGAALAIIML